MSLIFRTDIILKKTDQIQTIFSLKKTQKQTSATLKKTDLCDKTDICNKKTDCCIFFISIHQCSHTSILNYLILLYPDRTQTCNLQIYNFFQTITRLNQLQIILFAKATISIAIINMLVKVTKVCYLQCSEFLSNNSHIRRNQILTKYFLYKKDYTNKLFYNKFLHYSSYLASIKTNISYNDINLIKII